MSRARPIRYGDRTLWFDMLRNSDKATAEQLELLATVERIDLDDLLDEHVTQGEVISRLRYALGVTNTIPIEVLERRRVWRAARQVQPECRACGKQGDSTKHHFVNKWILRELEMYQQKWADRTRNCIPLCIDCHRDIHIRSNGPVSVAHLLNDTEKEFAEAALKALSEERPKLLILLARGDDSVYESRLVKDWIAGLFSPEALPVQEWRDEANKLRVVA